MRTLSQYGYHHIGTSGDCGVYQDVLSSLIEEEAYTISAWVYVVSGSGSVFLETYDGVDFARIQANTIGTGWQRITASDDIGADLTSACVWVGGSGEFYFDNMQLETGGISDFTYSATNLLVNPGFESAFASWSDWNDATRTWSYLGTDLGLQMRTFMEVTTPSSTVYRWAVGPTTAIKSGATTLTFSGVVTGLSTISRYVDIDQGGAVERLEDFQFSIGNGQSGYLSMPNLLGSTVKVYTYYPVSGSIWDDVFKLYQGKVYDISVDDSYVNFKVGSAIMDNYQEDFTDIFEDNIYKWIKQDDAGKTIPIVYGDFVTQVTSAQYSGWGGMIDLVPCIYVDNKTISHQVKDSPDNYDIGDVFAWNIAAESYGAASSTTGFNFIPSTTIAGSTSTAHYVTIGGSGIKTRSTAYYVPSYDYTTTNAFSVDSDSRWHSRKLVAEIRDGDSTTGVTITPEDWSTYYDINPIKFYALSVGFASHNVARDALFVEASRGETFRTYYVKCKIQEVGTRVAEENEGVKVYIRIAMPSGSNWPTDKDTFNQVTMVTAYTSPLLYGDTTNFLSMSLTDEQKEVLTGSTTYISGALSYTQGIHNVYLVAAVVSDASTIDATWIIEELEFVAEPESRNDYTSLFASTRGTNAGSWIAGRNGFSDDDYLDTPSYQLESILREHIGYTNIDTTYFDAAYVVTSGFRTAFSLTNPTDTKEILDQFALQTHSMITFNKDDAVRIIPLRSGANATTITTSDFVDSWVVTYTDQNYLMNDYKFNYRINYANGKYHSNFTCSSGATTFTDTIGGITYQALCSGSVARYNSPKLKAEYNFPFIRESGTAQLAGGLIADWHSYRHPKLECTLKMQKMELELGDRVLVTTPSITGSFIVYNMEYDTVNQRVNCGLIGCTNPLY